VSPKSSKPILNIKFPALSSPYISLLESFIIILLLYVLLSNLPLKIVLPAVSQVILPLANLPEPLDLISFVYSPPTCVPVNNCPFTVKLPAVSHLKLLLAKYPEPSCANFIALTIPLVEYPVSGVILEGVDHAPYVLGGVTVLNLIHIC
jgi:hypothetical protein